MKHTPIIETKKMWALREGDHFVVGGYNSMSMLFVTRREARDEWAYMPGTSVARVTVTIEEQTK